LDVNEQQIKGNVCKFIFLIYKILLVTTLTSLVMEGLQRYDMDSGNVYIGEMNDGEYVSIRGM